MIKLNLGCEKDIRKDYLNVDFEEFEGVDRVIDLNQRPYPFKEEEFEEILMYNILEHLNNPYEVMKEIYRITKSKGKVHLYVPYFSNADTWTDIQHTRGYSYRTFLVDNISCMFEIEKLEIQFSRYYFFVKPFANRFKGIYERFFAYIFPASYLNIILIKK